MNRDDLSDAIGGIDGRFIAEAYSHDPEAASGPSERIVRMKTKRMVSLALAAALILSLGLAAYAVGSIHLARQQELRQDLKVDENKAGSYVEYTLPETQEPQGAVLLSAVNDGMEERVYVNVSPVTEEELAGFAGGASRFSWSIEGYELGGFAGPSLPVDLNLSGKEAIREALLQYAYDAETQTATLECWLTVDSFKKAMEALGTDTVPLQLNLSTDAGTRCFGTIDFALTDEQSRSFDFGRAVYHDEEFDKDIEIVGLELTPFSAVWKVHYEGDALLHSPGGDQQAGRDWLLLEDKVCQDAQLVFSDGSSFSPGGALTTPYENGVVKQHCGWGSAIDIRDVQRIVLHDLVLWEAS